MTDTRATNAGEATEQARPHSPATDSTAPAKSSRAGAARTRRWWRRRPVNRALVLVHRWVALVVGLFLVVECTTGVVLLYRDELFRAGNSELFTHTTTTHPVSATQAISLVHRAHPDFAAQWVARDHGVFVVGDPSYVHQWYVDPGTGHLNGTGSRDKGFVGLLGNVHDCALGCAGQTGYTTWFEVPLWSGGPTFLTDITRGGFILGLLGLALIVLVLTSLKIWWPGIRKLTSRFVVRRGRGRFARDFDLHNVIGAVALPFLLMWGVTGAAFEFPVVEKAWIAITGGDQLPAPAYAVTPNAARANAPQVALAQARAAASRAVPGDISFVGLPTKDVPAYEFDIVTAYAADAHRGIYRGDAYVYVDAHDATNVASFDEGHGPAANRFYDKFLEPTHFGWNVNVWWRIVWAALGLSPLALMVTGISTWLFRRGVRKRRRAARAARSARPSPAT